MANAVMVSFHLCELVLEAVIILQTENEEGIVFSQKQLCSTILYFNLILIFNFVLFLQNSFFCFFY